MAEVKAYLVGAGPGDAGLATVRALELISQADVLVYDYLANELLLNAAPQGCECIFVGKKGFSRHITQEQINQLLLDKMRELQAAQLGRPATLVRLKGGDPFVFGRGGEEALALKQAGFAFEVVPGVTSGVAAPAYAGIPVTHRGLASSVTFITGHEDPTKHGSAISWPALAALCTKGGTLCFYMGVKNVGNIVQNLVAEGAPANTPVALVRWGTMPLQETLSSTLENVAEHVDRAQFKAPAIIVVGSVIALREELAWFEERPLFGKRIAITRSRTQASVLGEKLTALGASVYEFPTIEFAEPESFAALDGAIGNLAQFSCIVFTSANGVEGFFRRLQQQPATGGVADARALSGLRVAAIGPATAESLQAHGIQADIVPGEFRGEAVFEAIREAFAQQTLEGQRILIARAQVARETLPELLRQAGAEVVVAPVYQTVTPASTKGASLATRLESGELDAITFTASSTVENLVKILGPQTPSLLSGVEVFSIGPITSETLAKHGIAPVHEAAEYTIDGLVELLASTYASKKENNA